MEYGTGFGYRENFISTKNIIRKYYDTAELINSIEITIAIDIFGTIAIAIVKRISQLLLLIRCSISIEFFSCLEYAVFELLQWA